MSSNDDKSDQVTVADENSGDAAAATSESQAQPAPARRGGRGLAGLGLLLAAGALGLSGWLAYQAYIEPAYFESGDEQSFVDAQALEEQARAVSTLEQSIERVNTQLDAIERQHEADADRLGKRVERIEDRIDSRQEQTASLEQGLGRVDERTATLVGRVEALEEQLADQNAEAADLRRRLEAAVQQLDERGDLQREVDRDLRQQILMLEAAGLLRVGQDLAEVRGSWREAQRAFERARTRLESVDDARLDPVRRALAGEIEALAAHEAPKFDAELARLERLARASRSWPLQLPGSEPEDAAAGDEDAGWRSRLGRTFSSLVRVESRDELGRDEAQFEAAREQLQLRLVAAELALMRRDAASLETQIQAALGLLEEWFEVDAEPVAAAREQLQRLAGLDLRPDPPALGAALAQLQKRLDES